MTAPKDPPDASPGAAPTPSGLPALAPDFVEQDFADEIDNVIPTRGYQMLPVVALGGSAGCLQPLQTFFGAMQPDSGLAFVVIMHLSPEHESSLPEILQHSTKMPVAAAQNGDKLEKNKVYVIPPGKHLVATDGRLKLTDLEPERGRRVAVDLFFRSLGDTHGPRASVVVLSGADGDGAIGLKRVKERGGLTVAQDPDEAEHQSMPRAAIATGMVDWVLPAAEMPRRILDYHAAESRLRLPPEEGPPPSKPAPPLDESEAALREVLVFLRMRTGRDFSYYKRATIVRRISRRMQVNSLDDLPAYLAFLRMHPGESGALLQDLLISVTNFFRDRDAFKALDQHLPALVAGKDQGEAVRVWVPACATGEEAYSLAMLLLEHAHSLESPPSLQIFGCDLDEQAIQVARAGLYPEAIVADVSEERLRRFFTKERGGYRVRREVREMVLFAAHDLLKDPPFSRMDLISCRNLLIYLNREAQMRVLETFHFAMKPGGRLFLGTSESIDENSPLFKPLDKKYRIYQYLPAARTGLPVPTGPTTLLRALEAQQQLKYTPVLPGSAFTQGTGLPFAHAMAALEERASLGELHFKLLERFAPPSLMVNQQHEIVHLSENAGRFLLFSGGEPSVNLLRVVHPMLRVELRAALFRAAETNSPVEVFDLPLEIDGQSKVVDISVAPARELAPGYLLVVFSARESGAAAQRAAASVEPEPVVRHLERELEQVKSHLRDTVEQYEAGTEELKASNEELQAMNEELRSATEELETSREELQSINEELTAVNQELKAKVDELGQVNGDLHNLMASTAIATVFLDRDLRVMRYTPAAVSLFSLIPGDVGRPLADLNFRLDYPELIADARGVLDRLVPVEREVDDHSRWFLARLLPYRTIDDRIGGVVLTFIEITALKRAEEELRESRQDLEGALSVAQIGSCRYNPATATMKFDEIARGIYGLRASGETPFDMAMKVVHDEDREALVAKFEQTRRDATPLEAEYRILHPEKGLRWVLTRGGLARLPDGSAEIYTASLDVTKRKLAEEELRTRNQELERFNRVAVDRELRMVELKKEINLLHTRLGEAPPYRIEPA